MPQPVGSAHVIHDQNHTGGYEAQSDYLAKHGKILHVLALVHIGWNNHQHGSRSNVRRENKVRDIHFPCYLVSGTDQDKPFGKLPVCRIKADQDEHAQKKKP